MMNLLVASVAIVITAPVTLLIAAAIKATSAGPVIFRQRRIGRNRRMGEARNGHAERRGRDLGGVPFTVYKFRTMVHDGGKAERWSDIDDPRVTPLGRLLRMHHLDELPQLVNVLKGDMNVVGPRPEQPELFHVIRARAGTFEERQRVPPGITGLAQIHLPYARSVEDSLKKLELDLEYIRIRSLWTDVRIMIRTLPKLVRRASTEG